MGGYTYGRGDTRPPHHQYSSTTSTTPPPHTTPPTHHPRRRRLVPAQRQAKGAQAAIGGVDLAAVAHTCARALVVEGAFCCVYGGKGGLGLLGRREGRERGGRRREHTHTAKNTCTCPHTKRRGRRREALSYHYRRTHPFVQGVAQRPALRPHLIEPDVALAL